MEKLHDLKTHPEPFQAVWDGKKRFEFRNNDRNFQVGDQLMLKEWNPESGEYSGRVVRAKVTYMLSEEKFGLPQGFAILSIENIDRMTRCKT